MRSPGRLLLVDAIGALTTSLLLFGVVARRDDIFGMPSRSVYVLAGIAFCLFAYSMTCQQCVRVSWKKCFRLLMLGNTAYCALSIGLMIHHFPTMTTLGLIYFTLEVLIISLLVGVEYQVYAGLREDA